MQGMFTLAVLQTPESCSGKWQPPRLGFDAPLARESLRMQGVSRHVCSWANADGQPERVLICSHSDCSSKGRMYLLSVSRKDYTPDLRSQIPLRNCAREEKQAGGRLIMKDWKQAEIVKQKLEKKQYVSVFRQFSLVTVSASLHSLLQALLIKTDLQTFSPLWPPMF